MNCNNTLPYFVILLIYWNVLVNQKHLRYYVASIMTKTKSSHRQPWRDKRIRNSQPTNLQRATACYFNHILIIGAIRNIVVGGRVLGLEASSNRINSIRTIDFGETDLKCLSDFCHLFFILMSKVATNKKWTSTKEYGAIKYLFNTFIISLMTTFYKETWIISDQHENVPVLWCSAVPVVTKLKQG